MAMSEVAVSLLGTRLGENFDMEVPYPDNEADI